MLIMAKWKFVVVA